MSAVIVTRVLIFTIVGLCLWAQPSFAQDRQTVEEKIPRDIIYSAEDKVFTVVVENDIFGSKGTDEYYTSGVRLGYFDINADLPQAAYALDDVIPTFEMNETTSVFYSLGQNIYTPRDITRRTQAPNDRPWAAHLYGAMGLATITDNHMDQVELSLGIVGPAALGEQTQKFVHDYIATDGDDPKGWDNQLDNEPTIGIGWVRRYPQYMTARLGGVSLGVVPYFGATLGNAHTFAQTGFNLRLTPETEKWQDSPARVRPGLPGTGFFELPEKGWSWYLFAGLDGRAVARNIFLDGNTFRQSHSVNKKPFVMDANVGLALTYDQYRLSYTLVNRTREFDGQDDSTVFGAISFGYRF